MSAAKAPQPSSDEFPIVCETCLGPNPYIRMQRHLWGSACKVCERPFTSFRWRPAGLGTRPKKTEICQTCARSKNVCQVCILDLKYGLPVQVRDASMPAADKQRAVVPKSDASREYAVAQAERDIANGDIDAVYNAPMVNNIAEKVKRTAPRYDRNRARVCSFFLKGQCKRGLYCPYRHEKPQEGTDDSMTDQNLRDRYYGVNDPVAAKILQKAGVTPDGRRRSSKKSNNAGPPPPPEDKSIQTLFIGGVVEVVKESDLRKLFSAHPGLSNIAIIANKGFAFAEFSTRKAAENAINSLYGQQEVNGARVFVNWGRGNRKSSSAPSNPSPLPPPPSTNREDDKAPRMENVKFPDFGKVRSAQNDSSQGTKSSKRPRSPEAIVEKDAAFNSNGPNHAGGEIVDGDGGSISRKKPRTSNEASAVQG